MLSNGVMGKLQDAVNKALQRRYQMHVELYFGRQAPSICAESPIYFLSAEAGCSLPGCLADLCVLSRSELLDRARTPVVSSTASDVA